MAAVRAVRESDHPEVAAIAVACDETGPVSGADPRYLAHVEKRGRVAVVEDATALVGFGGQVDVDGVAFLTDLFVAPGSRGAGRGSALLAELWGGSASRATSSSQDPRALASYARYGAQPRWPLMYLEIRRGGRHRAGPGPPRRAGRRRRRVVAAARRPGDRARRFRAGASGDDRSGPHRGVVRHRPAGRHARPARPRGARRRPSVPGRRRRRRPAHRARPAPGSGGSAACGRASRRRRSLVLDGGRGGPRGPGAHASLAGALLTPAGSSRTVDRQEVP